MEKKYKKIVLTILIALALILIICIIVGVFNFDGNLSEASVFWSNDAFDALISEKDGDFISSHGLKILNSNGSGITEGTYKFEMQNNSETIRITAHGALNLYKFSNGISAYNGFLEGETTIDGVLYDVNVNVDSESSVNTLFASITLQPRNGINNMFFSIGTPFITDEMWEKG